MSTTTTTTTAAPSTETAWSSLRNSDGTPIIISFDWDDDHSGWRLEDLRDSIDEARKLLADAGIETGTVDNLYELGPVARHLRELHRTETISDAVVRRALVLADELDLPDDIGGFDANSNYEDTFVYLREVLEAWDAAHRWAWTSENWNVTAVDELERLCRGRYGLGDRWTVRVSDGLVELPGTDIEGANPDRATASIFDVFTATNYDDGQLGQIAAKLVHVDPSLHENLQKFADTFERIDVDIRPDTVDKVVNVVATIDTDRIDQIIETIERLGEDWYDSTAALIDTAVSLEIELVR